MKTSHWALLFGALAVAGCNGAGGRGGQAQDSVGRIGMDSGRLSMGPMDSGGMGGGGMHMQDMQMMSNMSAHMDSMMRLSPRQMQAMMATHQGMMSQMMDAMGADMRGRRMSASPQWSALTDSVKQDLGELPNLRGQALSARMRAHADRVKRLLAMHEKMLRK
jgi:hypothetical protein